MLKMACIALELAGPWAPCPQPICSSIGWTLGTIPPTIFVRHNLHSDCVGCIFARWHGIVGSWATLGHGFPDSHFRRVRTKSYGTRASWSFRSGSKCCVVCSPFFCCEEAAIHFLKFGWKGQIGLTWDTSFKQNRKLRERQSLNTDGSDQPEAHLGNMQAKGWQTTCLSSSVCPCAPL